MKEKLWAFCRKLISLALNLSILYMETIAMPISWDYGHELVFTMYEDGNGWYIMLFTGSMLYHHFLNPVVAMVSFLLFEREPRLPLASVPLALVPTIVYGVYDLWGNITGRIDGPYPFMRVYAQTIQESLMWFAIILGTNLLYAFVLWWLGGNGKKHRKKGPKLEFMG